MNVYPFIEAEQAGQHSVKRACELLEVSRAAFYQRAAGPSRRDVADEELFEAIKDAHAESGGTYGSPRVHRALRDAGRRCGRKRVARIMRKKGLVGRCPKRWRKTTEQDPDAMSHGRGSHLSGVRARRGDRPALVRRHHLRLDLGRMDVPGHRHRHRLPPRRGLGHGRPPPRRTGLRRPERRRDPTPAAARGDLPLRPGMPSTPARSSVISPPSWASRSRSAGPASAGTTPCPRAGSRPTRPSSSTPAPGPPRPAPAGPPSSTSRAGTTSADSTAPSATAAPPPTKPPSTTNPAAQAA